MISEPLTNLCHYLRMYRQPGLGAVGLYVGAVVGFLLGVFIHQHGTSNILDLPDLWFSIKMAAAFGIIGALLAWLSIFLKMNKRD